jgi:hypothetical protein
MERIFLMFLDHTQRCTTVCRTPLDEWSARHRDLYLSVLFSIKYHLLHNLTFSVQIILTFCIHHMLKCKHKPSRLTLILLTWRIWWAPNNASRWQMGFNSAFKGLKKFQWCNEQPNTQIYEGCSITSKLNYLNFVQFILSTAVFSYTSCISLEDV